jgi:Zn-dependent peptidase ImmA (M78 family)
MEKINRPKSEWPEHPMTINAGYKIFDIVQDPKLKEFGAVEFVKSTMYLNPHQKDEDYKGTLIHEMLHIVFEMWGFGEGNTVGNFCNEDLTTRTGYGLHTLAMLNPELFEFMFSPPK